MKIELKEFQYYPQLSEETVAYSAVLFIDGVDYGRVLNRGGGACDEVDHKAIALLSEYAKTQPPVETDWGTTIECSWETLLGDAAWEVIDQIQTGRNK